MSWIDGMTQPSAGQTGDRHVPGLDGLRGLAAFMVVVSHTLIPGTDIGGLSVFLFFILSGYLITRILIRSREKIEMHRATITSAFPGRVEAGFPSGHATIWSELKRFWINRALRIFPAYYVWLGFFLVVDHIYYQDQTINHLIWYLFYVQNFLVAFVTHTWEDFTHTWSLAVEQQFYVFFAPLVLLVASRRHVALFVATAVLALVVDTVLMLKGAEMVTLYPVPATGFIFMAAGAVLAKTPVERLAGFAHPALVVGYLIVVGLLAAYPWFERNDIAHVPYVLLIALSAASLAALMAAILAAPDTWPVRLLETSLPRLFGRISYALYIIHLPVSLWMWDFGGMDDLATLTHIPAEIICFVAVLAVSVPLALLSYRFVEKPCLDLKRPAARSDLSKSGVPL